MICRASSVSTAPPPPAPPMVERSSLQPKPCSAPWTMAHALDYAIFMDWAAERSECSSSTASSSRATPGQNHFSSANSRAVRRRVMFFSMKRPSFLLTFCHSSKSAPC